MKWRALVVAVAGLSAALWACSFGKEWETYCTHPGRCAQFDDAGADASIQVAQGTVNREIFLAGQYLEGATATLDQTDAGMVSVDPVVDGGIVLHVSVNHGVGVGERLTVRFHWERDQEDKPVSLMVTAITADPDAGDDTNGSGTPTNPYRSLLRANQHSDTGDIIKLAPGTFDSICAGLKSGVTVEGVPGGGSVVLGTNAAGSCGFSLSDPAQALRFVTISTFPVGLTTTTIASGRPTAFQVTVQNCDTGVYVPLGGTLLLQESTLDQNGNGLALDGGDVVVQGGTIKSSARNGVLMTGAGGALSLIGATVNNNAPQAGDDLTGAGVLIASSGGTATIGSNINANGHTGVTITGTANQVIFDGGSLQSPYNNSSGLVVKDNSATVSVRNTTFKGSPIGLKVEGFTTFNGGTGADAYGNNTFLCSDTDLSTCLEIVDARSNLGPAMDFADTTIRGLHMDAGERVRSPSTLGITFANPGNEIHFH